MSAVKKEYLPEYTYNDYINWEGDWELINGIAYAMAPSPILTHQAISSLLIQSLGGNLKECKNCMVVSEMDYKLSNDTILRPDIALICGQKEGKYIKKSPELIIEIVSQTSAKRDEEIKFDLYESEKIKYYILLYPQDLKAKIYELQHNKYEKIVDILDGSFEFKDIECNAKIDFNFVFERFR
ncbi:MAG TPA: Uma2 family endonuclease [Campylobacterales bacterium]|nr:Uma2 family endonuclease [Campylobacterales bacterium]